MYLFGINCVTLQTGTKTITYEDKNISFRSGIAPVGILL